MKRLAIILFFVLFVMSGFVCRQSRRYVLVLSKAEKKLVVLDCKTLETVAKIPVGEDPHEIVTNADGSLAYISIPLMNASGHEISVFNLKTLKPENTIETKPLYIPHGLVYLNDKLWFTALKDSTFHRTEKNYGRRDRTGKS